MSVWCALSHRARALRLKKSENHELYKDVIIGNPNNQRLRKKAYLSDMAERACLKVRLHCIFLNVLH